jgi:hypothetical protein
MPQGGRLFHFTGVIRLCDAKRRADEPEQKLLLFHFRPSGILRIKPPPPKKRKKILFIAQNQNEVRFWVKSFCEGEPACRQAGTQAPPDNEPFIKLALINGEKGGAKPNQYRLEISFKKIRYPTRTPLCGSSGIIRLQPRIIGAKSHYCRI